MNRIETLTELTKGIDCLLDIGTDHGYLIIESLKRGHINKAIASDVNLGPLSQAKKNVEREQFSHLVDLVLSNGFEAVKKPFDGVCIAGMGMHLISNILSQKHLPAKKYILQTNTNVKSLRLFLSNNNYKIIDERVVYDKHYYIIIVAEVGTEQLSDADALLGPILRYRKTSLKYYDKQVIKLEKIINSVTNDKVTQFSNELNLYKNTIDFLKTI